MASGKKVYLTMQQRLDVLKDLETSSISSIARKYNVHHTTIRRVKEKATIITQFTEKSKKEQHRKTIRKPVYKDLEQRLLTWFIERRTMGDTVSDLILLEKAAELKEKMAGCSNFKMSKGWLINFKRRHGIRLVRIHGEKASANVNGAKIFVRDFQSIIEDDDINPENIDNMDESGLLWKALPTRTLTSDSERCVSGQKMRKEEEEQDDVRDGKRGGEMDEGSDEESAEGEGTRERGMKWSNEAREDLSDIFNRLEGYQNHMPPSAQLFIKGLKGLILGDTNQGQ